MSKPTEAIADRALIRVLADGATLGTAFAVAPGWVVTCHHVVDGHARIILEAADGSSEAVDASKIHPNPKLDLALLAADVGEAPPVALSHPDYPRFFSKGYAFGEAGVTSALPVPGTVSGSTSVRYAGRGRRYEVEDVWLLSEAAVDHGLSGAPVLDREWGVALAVVNTRFWGEGLLSGFGLPLDTAANRWPMLAGVLSTNRRAAFGPYINGAGAAEVCRRSVEATLKELSDAGLVLADRYRPRPSVRHMVDAFLESGKAMLPLVAPTGVGKTNELAHLATALQERSTSSLLIRGGAIARDSSGLDDAVRRILARTVGGLLPDRDPVGVLMSALAADGHPLIVLVDGLNEAPPELRGVWREWFARSLAWLEAHGAKLIFSSRPELWHDLQSAFPAGALAALATADQDDGDGDARRHASGVVLLSDFSEAEAARLLDAYDLTGSQLRPADVRHPLDARTYWERGLGRGAKRLSRLDLLQLLVSTRRDRVVLSVDKSAAVAVDVALGGIARHMRLGGGLSLTQEAFGELYREFPAVMAALINEGVLQATSSGYRFAFDGMAEVLQARQLNPQDILTVEGLEQVAAGEGIGPSVLALVLLTLEDAEGGLGPGLSTVLDAWEKATSFWLEMLFVRCLTQARDPGPLIGLAERYLESTAHGTGLSAFWRNELVTDIDLPTSERLALLRLAIRHEHGFEWESHHWGMAAPHSRPGVPSRLAQTVLENPVAAFRVLAEWLGDRRGLRERATVAEVAMGLMWWYADRAFDELLDVLADHPSEPVSFLWQLAERWPNQLMGVCERWISEAAINRHDVAIAAARGLLARRGGDQAGEISARAIRLMRRARTQSPSERARRESLAGLIAAGKAPASVLNEALRKYEAGEFPGEALVPGLETHFDRVFPAIAKRLGPTTAGKDALWLITRHLPRDAARFRRIVAAVDQAFPPGAELDSDVGLNLERLFYRISIDPDETDRLLDLARRLIRFGINDGWRPLVYVATWDANSAVERSVARRVFDLLLSYQPSEKVVTELIGSLGSSVGSKKREIRALLAQKIVPRADVEEMLLQQAVGRPKLAASIEAVFRGAEYLPAETGRRFLDIAASGMDPGDAALEALRVRYGF